MSDALKHECGIALLRLKKPLEYYKEKYGTAFYGVQKMYLLMEKQHNRGQDGAGLASIKLDVAPGERYISRIRSNQAQPIQDVFAQINSRINEEMEQHPEYQDDVAMAESEDSLHRRIVLRARALRDFRKKQYRKRTPVFASEQLDAP